MNKLRTSGDYKVTSSHEQAMNNLRRKTKFGFKSFASLYFLTPQLLKNKRESELYNETDNKETVTE